MFRLILALLPLVLSYLFSNLATCSILIGGQPLVIDAGHPPSPTTPQIFIAQSGLSNFRGLSFRTPDGQFVRHSGYQLILSTYAPTPEFTDPLFIRDSTFLLEPVMRDGKLLTHTLKPSNLPFYGISSAQPPTLTIGGAAPVTLKFTHQYGWYCMLLGRYSPLLSAILLVWALFSLPMFRQSSSPSSAEQLAKSVNFTAISTLATLAVLVAYLLFVRAAFFPGLFTNDSIFQLNSGLKNTYDTWHPPAMSWLAGIILKSGLSLESMMTAQLCIGAVGFFILIYSLLSVTPYTKRLTITTLISLLFFSPLFPFAPYLVTFWKDAWAGITIIWAAITIILIQRSKQGFYPLIFLYSITALLFTVTRHNSILIAPIWGLILYVILGSKTPRHKPRIIASFVFSLALLTAQPLTNSLLRAKQTFPEEGLYGTELLSALKLDPSFAALIPYTVSQIAVPNWQEQFQFGSVGAVYGWGTKRIMKPGYADQSIGDPALRREYRSAFIHAPWLLIKVKLLGFLRLLYHPIAPYADGIAENDLGIHFDRNSALQRASLYWILDRIWGSSYALLLMPLVTLTLLVLLTIRDLLLTFKTTTAPASLPLNLLAVSLFFIFLPFSPEAEYRYLFPALFLATPMVFLRLSKILSSGRLAQTEL